jgi:ATP-dependent Clp protease ATP-binding subunit ClpA
VHDTVTEEEIAEIVAKWTGIPVARSWRASGRSCCIWTT